MKLFDWVVRYDCSDGQVVCGSNCSRKTASTYRAMPKAEFAAIGGIEEAVGSWLGAAKRFDGVGACVALNVGVAAGTVVGATVSQLAAGLKSLWAPTGLQPVVHAAVGSLYKLEKAAF